MAKHIKQIADGLGADIIGQVSNTGGAFGAAKVALDAAALSAAAGTGLGPIGALREDADLLDEIVEDAMRRRRMEAWCPGPEDFAALEAMIEETGRSLNELLDEALRLLLERRAHQPGSIAGGPDRGHV
jgi:hypothetical protein